MKKYIISFCYKGDLYNISGKIREVYLLSNQAGKKAVGCLGGLKPGQWDSFEPYLAEDSQNHRFGCFKNIDKFVESDQNSFP